MDVILWQWLKPVPVTLNRLGKSKLESNVHSLNPSHSSKSGKLIFDMFWHLQNPFVPIFIKDGRSSSVILWHCENPLQ